MRIGIGLPNPVPGVRGVDLVEFARRGEAYDFAGLATIDRIAYPGHDSLATLAAAAGATSQIELLTNILLGPAYPPALLARAAASIDQLSGGRLTLGLAVGARPDDFTVTGRDFHTRGRDLDAGLDLMHRAWRGEPIGGDVAICPTPVNDRRVPLLFGGTSDQAVRRMVRWGEGWTAGGGGPEMAAPFYARIRDTWRAAGRAGEPRLAGLAYYSLGEDVIDDSYAYLRGYYANLGQWAEQIAAAALRTPQQIRDAIAGWRDAGCTELYLVATVGSPDQVDRLRDAM